MTALIVIFITLSLMGSALWIMPHKKERQRMALRMHARKLGLTVQLTSIDLPDKWDKSINRQKTVAYSFYRLKPIATLPPQLLLLPFEVWKYHALADGWWSSKFFELNSASKDTLERYGHLLTAVKITPEYVALYWSEAGDEEALAALTTLIFSLAELKTVNT